jgi:acetyl esterase/lipase
MQDAPGSAPVVLFLHGGGFIFEAVPPHWMAASHIVAKTGAELWFAEYPLLPEATAYESHDMVMAVWHKMCERHDPASITVIGDSAGAALSLMLAHSQLASGGQMPRQLILVSPGQTLIDDPALLAQMQAIAPLDVMLPLQLLVNINSLMEVRPDRPAYVMRPLEGDFSGFPPTAVFSATREILFPQATQLAEALLDAGSLNDFVIGEGMCHVWPYTPVAPEGVRALRRIVELIAEAPAQA